MELTPEQGTAAFQLSALDGLSLLRSITEDLGRIERIHRPKGTRDAWQPYELKSAQRAE
ncbi:MAG: hypothetical protein AAF748_00915 [Pseudomonadota bacterium]